MVDYYLASHPNMRKKRDLTVRFADDAPQARAGVRFHHAADFYRMMPERFHPMIGSGVEDRRFENQEYRGGILPYAPDAPVTQRIPTRLKGPGRPLGAYKPSGLPSIEREVDKYLADERERVNAEKDRELSKDLDDFIKRSEHKHHRKDVPTS